MDVLQLDDYRIKIGALSQTLDIDVIEKKYSKYFILVDENTAIHCLPRLSEMLSVGLDQMIKIQPGEIYKTLGTCTQIWNGLLEQNADRKSLLINLGGGVIGDMGGFCASVYKRGIDFLQVPTTLLSMVDSSIGGKLGIDMSMVKNIIGVFNNPIEVLIDPEFLTTLEYRQIMSGMAETFKHALINDTALWESVKNIKYFDLSSIESTIKPSLCVKKNIVKKDPFEAGDRKALNFGHTIGHAIETYYLDNGYDLLHGEAVILGIIAELFISENKKLLNSKTLLEIIGVLEKNYSELQLKQLDPEKLMSYMANDKKNEYGNVQCTLLRGVGQYEINCPVGMKDLEIGLEGLKTIYN